MPGCRLPDSRSLRAAPRRPRRGAVYILVLAVSLAISVIGLTAMTTARLAHRDAVRGGDAGDARMTAVAGMEHAVHLVNLAIETAESFATNWRDSFTHAAKQGPFAIGPGSFTWSLHDEIDADLGDDPLDPVVIVVEATAGAAIHRLSTRLEPGPGSALDCLAIPVVAGGRLDLDGARLESDGTVHANLDAIASGSDVYATVTTVSGIAGGTYHGTTDPAAAPRELPDPSSVFDYYLARGTYILASAIEHIGSNDAHLDLQDLVLTPYLNPYGPPNPEGIYIVDCQGRHLKIKNSRIIGTIVVLNGDPLKPTKIEKSLTWQPAFPNYPALLVQGDLIFKLEDPPLSEAARLTNFNPPGAPYQGLANATQTDSLPNVIAGIFYASGSITAHADNTSGHQYIEGTVIAGGDFVMLPGSEMFIRYLESWLGDPPPGFQRQDGPMELVSESWRRLVQ